MNTQIKASFKQIQIKGTEATAQFTVISGAKGFNDLTRMVGQNGTLTFDGEQQELPMDEVPKNQVNINYYHVDINYYHVDSDTGEVTDYEDVPALPEGGEE